MQHTHTHTQINKVPSDGNVWWPGTLLYLCTGNNKFLAGIGPFLSLPSPALSSTPGPLCWLCWLSEGINHLIQDSETEKMTTGQALVMTRWLGEDSKSVIKWEKEQTALPHSPPGPQSICPRFPPCSAVVCLSRSLPLSPSLPSTPCSPQPCFLTLPEVSSSQILGNLHCPPRLLFWLQSNPFAVPATVKWSKLLFVLFCAFPALSSLFKSQFQLEI